MTRVPAVPLSLALLAATLAGCTKPEPPDKDRPPEPTAAATTAYVRPVEKHDDLLRYMQTPIEKAKTTEQTVMDAAQAQRSDIEAQTQGNAPSAPAEQPPAY